MVHEATEAGAWNDLLRLAYRAARASNDPSTQNAALLVESDGSVVLADVNRFPDGVAATPERWERPGKYRYVEHAERNLCYRAARRGIAMDRLTMVCPWAPCPECARAIIQSGIVLLVTHKQAHDRTPERWRGEIAVAFAMLAEAGVEVVMVDGAIGGTGVLRHSGEEWEP